MDILQNVTNVESTAIMAINAESLITRMNLDETIDDLLADNTIAGINHSALRRAISAINYFGICISIFGISCIISIKDFSRKELHLPQSVIIGIGLQYLIQPFVGYILANLLQLEQPEALAMILLSSCPVSPYCAILVYYGDGFIIVALCLTMFSTALAAGLLPLWFTFYSRSWTEEYFVIATPSELAAVELLIIVPGVLGVIFKRYAGLKAGRIMAKICSFAFIVTTIISPIMNAIENPSHFIADAKLWVGGFLLPMVGFVLGFLLTFFIRLPYDACSAVSLAVGTSNWFLASDITLKFFSRDATVLKDALTLVSIFSIAMPLEGFIWSMMYRVIEEFFRRVYPKCCSGDDDDNEEENECQVSAIAQMEQT